MAFLNVFHRAYTDVMPSDTPPTQRALIVNKAGLPTLYSRSKLFAFQGMDAPTAYAEHQNLAVSSAEKEERLQQPLILEPICRCRGWVQFLIAGYLVIERA